MKVMAHDSITIYDYFRLGSRLIYRRSDGYVHSTTDPMVDGGYCVGIGIYSLSLWHRWKAHTYLKGILGCPERQFSP